MPNAKRRVKNDSRVWDGVSLPLGPPVQHVPIPSYCLGQSAMPGCVHWSQAECSEGRVGPLRGPASTRFPAGQNRICTEVPSVTQKRAFLNQADNCTNFVKVPEKIEFPF